MEKKMTNEKALAALDRIQQAHDEYSGEHKTGGGDEDFESIRQALEPPAQSSVEELDETIERVEDACQQYGARAYYMPEDIALIVEAAQGRPQSAPEGWKLVPIEPTSQMVSAAGTHIENPNPYMGIRNSYQAMLSAAPPVTGGAWLDIESAPKDGTRVLLLHDRYGAGSGHFDERWHLHFCLNKDAVPQAWQPLPAPPSSQTRGG